MSFKYTTLHDIRAEAKKVLLEWGIIRGNTSEYTPSLPYDPVTKKYVDDAIDGIDVSGGGDVSSVFGRTGAVVAVADDYTWAQINKTTSDVADLASKSHTDLSDIGSNTHAQIDTHISSTSNPHSVDEGDILPDQSGHNGDYLTSNGSVSSWGPPPGAPVTSVFGRSGDVVATANDYTWAQIDKTSSNISDLGTKSHTSLDDIGSNTHAQIDTHIGGDGSDHADVATNTAHATGDGSDHSDVASNTSARHTHANQAQLDLVTDGDHDARTDDPHGTLDDVVYCKAISVEDPTSSEDISVFFTNAALTITEIRAVVRGSSPSVTWTIRHGTDRSAAGSEAVTGGTTTTSESTGSDVTSFDDATVVADSFIWLETTAQSGTVDELHVTIVYTYD